MKALKKPKIVRADTRISNSAAQYTLSYEGALALDSDQEQKSDIIKLSAVQENELSKALKAGMLKQLCQKGWLTDMQLNELIKRQL